MSRDGQKKPVHIYRFLTTNSIDEKIYQRQITKTGLAEQMLDHNAIQERTKDCTCILPLLSVTDQKRSLLLSCVISSP